MNKAELSPDRISELLRTYYGIGDKIAAAEDTLDKLLEEKNRIKIEIKETKNLL